MSVDHQHKLCYCWTPTLWDAKIPPIRIFFFEKRSLLHRIRTCNHKNCEFLGLSTYHLVLMWFIYLYTTYILRSILSLLQFYSSLVWIIFIWCFWSAFGPTLPTATGQALRIFLPDASCARLGFEHWCWCAQDCSAWFLPIRLIFLPVPSTVGIYVVLKPQYWSFRCVVHFDTRGHFLIFRILIICQFGYHGVIAWLISSVLLHHSSLSNSLATFRACLS